MSDITQLLLDAREGDSDIGDQLLSLVYDKLRSIAQQQLRKMRAHDTLNTTALVNEAYLKLSQADQMTYRDRLHFYAVSSQAMRYILVDYARRHSAQRRGGDWRQVTLDQAVSHTSKQPALLLDLNDALERLSELDPRLVQIVEYLYFGGLSQTDVAEQLEISERTVRREWTKAKAWLTRELRSYEVDE